MTHTLLHENLLFVRVRDLILRVQLERELKCHFLAGEKVQAAVVLLTLAPRSIELPWPAVDKIIWLGVADFDIHAMHRLHNGQWTGPTSARQIWRINAKVEPAEGRLPCPCPKHHIKIARERSFLPKGHLRVLRTRC